LPKGRLRRLFSGLISGAEPPVPELRGFDAGSGEIKFRGLGGSYEAQEGSESGFFRNFGTMLEVNRNIREPPRNVQRVF
jgi:hypothetical protein